MTIQQIASAIAVVGTIVLCTPAAKADEGTSRVIARTLPRPGGPVVAKTDADGAIHLLYDSEDGPKYGKSTDDGVTFQAIPVLSEGSRKKGLKYSGWDLAVGKGGRVHVAMGTNAWQLKLPREEWGYLYASLDPGSSQFSPVRNINHKPSEGFSIAADDRGNVTACWLADKLYANVSTDNGETFAPFVEINPQYNPCNCCTTSAAYGEDGRLAILYREETKNDRDMYLVLWDQARNQSSRTRMSRTLWNVNACPMSYYAIARAPAGYVAVWPTRGEVFFTRLDIKGEPSGEPEIKTSGKSGMRTGLLALSGTDGNTLVVWRDGDRIAWQLYGADGQPLGRPGSVESRGAGVAGVVDNAGRFVLFH